VHRPVTLVRTETSDLLATWGFLTPCVLLPAHASEWNEGRIRAALSHEFAHIRRGDWIAQLSSDILRVLFWFNPLFWMLCARLRREAEHASDDVVLGMGLSSTVYASHLLEIAKACRPQKASWVPVTSASRPSLLEGRIAAMLNTRLNRQPPTRRMTAMAVSAFFAIVFSAASFQLAAQDVGPRTLSGSVYDTSGSLLPGVTVTLINDQQSRWPTTTDERGRFVFAPVGAGEYELEVKIPGFAVLNNAFTLKAAHDWNRNVTMQVGELEEKIRVVAKRPTQVAQPASTGGPVRIGGNIKAPRKLKDVNPIYPPAMRDAGLEGMVPVEALIAVDGSVASVRILSAQVHPDFARAAEDAVRQWTFTPTLLNGVPVELRMTAFIAFTLED
jgi:TonB family protein